MKYIVFYQKVFPTEIQCVGSDSIIIPDQRYSIITLIGQVVRNKYYRPTSAIGFAICKGSSILNLHKVSETVLFTNKY